MAVAISDKQIVEIVSRLKSEHPERWASIKYLRSRTLFESVPDIEEQGDKNHLTILTVLKSIEFPDGKTLADLTDKDRSDTHYYAIDKVRDCASAELKAEGKI